MPRRPAPEKPGRFSLVRPVVTLWTSGRNSRVAIGRHTLKADVSVTLARQLCKVCVVEKVQSTPLHALVGSFCYGKLFPAP
jgi:hypothetical protein